jgi:hypothetical protein
MMVQKLTLITLYLHIPRFSNIHWLLSYLCTQNSTHTGGTKIRPINN